MPEQNIHACDLVKHTLLCKTAALASDYKGSAGEASGTLVVHTMMYLISTYVDVRLWHIC